MEVIKIPCFRKPLMLMGFQIIKAKEVATIINMLIMNIKVEVIQYKEYSKNIEAVIKHKIQTI